MPNRRDGRADVRHNRTGEPSAMEAYLSVGRRAGRDPQQRRRRNFRGLMNIGIDARMYGPHVGGGGLGRYVEQLVRHLEEIDQDNRYVLFLKPENINQCPANHARITKRETNIHWYTLREQWSLAKQMDAESLDLIHFPHWNVPLGLKTPFVVTIHDLILLEEPFSARATTKHPFLYALKYAGFRRVLAHTIRNARQIITVSEYTKQSIQKFFPEIPAEKIHVIYEGVTDLGDKRQGTGDNGNIVTGRLSPVTPPYFLCVGNAYPHKNLEALLHAFSFFHKLHPDVSLVFAGRSDLFYERLKRELAEIDIPNDRVHFAMNPSDQNLHALYHHAALYLIPSRLEGFGLPPLEAMREGIPVAASRRGSLPEILGDAAVYFSPDDIEEMVRVMEQVLLDLPLRETMVKKGQEQVKRYSWERMAQETLMVYLGVEGRG
ncbi:MAG: glycosyl transferase, group 1 [Candidatus Uhrbacteria bacterium GW2011_GWA2_53_10]|uniref:Glycosyl transferase, group 1 n=1 Tax=Candidatus Uhrbacteria bacterium GW2011_GWA2_53_10 TaxID=1618980 RepID=A0A0G1XQS5_9BACT|nr:MAG: glycosyl transferase, group 1 [Candidatus Uhrbacteria bacterium GW2011_GWA2_53_10]